MIPKQTTIDIVGPELIGACAWAERRGFPLEWDPSLLTLRVSFKHRESHDLFYLLGQFDDYKALAPAWEFTDSTWQPGQKRLHLYPKAAPGVSSIYHGSAVLCAPFNRLAFQRFGGPHADWGDATQWMNAGAGYIQARTIGDMLSAIHRDFPTSVGRMG